MGVEEQVTEGNRVASDGSSTAPTTDERSTLRGITISRFDEDGRILEDHAHSDTISLAPPDRRARRSSSALEILTRRAKLPKGALRRTSP